MPALLVPKVSRPLIGALFLAVLVGSLASEATAVSSSRRSGLKEQVQLGVQYFKRKDYGQAYQIWRRVDDKLIEKELYERDDKRPTVAKIHYLIGFALFKAKKYQGAARYWRQTLSLVPNYPKALKGLRLLAKAGKIDADEVAPDPDFPPRKGGGSTGEVPIPTEKPAPTTPPEPTAEPVPEGPRDILENVTQTPDKEKMRAAWEEAKRMLQFGQAKDAILKLKEAYQFGQKRADVDYQLGHAYLTNEQPEFAVLHFKKALENPAEDKKEVYLAMGKAHGLGNDVQKEIANYERVLQLDADYGEAHFMLALAYDKVDNSPKVLEHAQKAIRIDPEYKEKLKPRIKDSNVSKKIGKIVSNVLRDSKYERLTDEKIEEYAEEIGRILGEENLNTDEFMGGDSKTRIKGVLTDIQSGKSAKDALNSHVPKGSQAKFLQTFKKSPKLQELANEIKDKYKEGGQ